MANSITIGIADLAPSLFTQDDGTSVEDILKAGSGIVYAVEIDNTLNTAASYFKAYNVTAAVTVGTTVPDMVLYAPAATKITYVFPRGITFATGLKTACVTTGGTGGTTAPTSNVAYQVSFN